jgi:hypothetical protein
VAPVSADSFPPSLRWAVLLLYLEAVAVAALAVVLGYLALTRPAASTASAAAVVACTAGLALLLGLLGALLSRRRSAARGPAIVLELLFLPIGYYMIGGGVPWFGAPVMLAGLACAALLLAPATREALGIR